MDGVEVMALVLNGSDISEHSQVVINGKSCDRLFVNGAEVWTKYKYGFVPSQSYNPYTCDNTFNQSFNLDIEAQTITGASTTSDPTFGVNIGLGTVTLNLDGTLEGGDSYQGEDNLVGSYNEHYTDGFFFQIQPGTNSFRLAQYASPSANPGWFFSDYVTLVKGEFIGDVEIPDINAFLRFRAESNGKILTLTERNSGCVTEIELI